MASHIGRFSTRISTQLRRRSMKRMLICCLTGLVLLVTVAGLKAQTEGTQKAVSALEHQWLQAQNTSKPDMLAPLLADNFVSTSPEGKVSGNVRCRAPVCTSPM